MLAGTAVAAPTMAETAERILNQEPEALARFNYGVPADVDAVVRKALAKDRPSATNPRASWYLDRHHARERIARDRTTARARHGVRARIVRRGGSGARGAVQAAGPQRRAPAFAA